MEFLLLFALACMALEILMVVIFIAGFYIGVIGWIFEALIKFVIRCTKPFR